ncbi:hypothetical protein SLEP1_g21874 [Rubroshorea leprosula]|uniref:RING-type domain-containing protein n=1 Tax=Rubroshorea leprosula TaxID=152421 RepID=A0AAV5JJG6_9ROSI|nr:hypothetical protein SLEP1_g21874 [Rubroshorea leprosula]
MGSGGSKASCGDSLSSASSTSSGTSGGGGRRRRSKGKSKVFQSCLGPPSGSRESDVDEQVKIDLCRKVTVEQSDENRHCVSSHADLDDWRQAAASSRAGSSSASDAPNRFLSRFNLIPGNVSFRLSRAASLGSSRAYPVSPTSLAMLNDENEIRLQSGTARNFVDGISNQHPRTLMQRPEDSSRDIPASNCSSSFHGNLSISPTNEGAGGDGSTRVAVDVNSHSPRVFNELDGIENRFTDRRIGGREPADQNVSFSRTLSVGRLRDRVLRRSSQSDLAFCPVQQGREARDARQRSETLTLRGETRVLASPPPSSAPAASSSSGSIFNMENHEVEASRSREARYHDLLEHRSNFLERRRRIRSQVRALQRLGSRFENLSGHERSCILSGQHRSGRCTCRVNNRDLNSNDDTNARASISRIVMLAEALFEVLDEIHQQSVVLSSRPSVSSIGSVPAPNEVVESLPVKIYAKSHKLQTDEAAQCYICLVEYEDGDSLRILPCNHEFHKLCIDKWLKEIHRVCPLCRGDICRSDSLPAES